MDLQQQYELEKLFKTRLHQAMRFYLETCTHCGLCVDSCHVYNSMPELRYTAVGRSEVVRKIFVKYFKQQGKIAPWLGEVMEMDEFVLDKFYEAAFSCTGCRRCMVHCPFGIDTQQIMSIAKLLLVGADKEPKILTMLSDMSINKGEQVEDSRAQYAEAIANIEPEVEAIWPTAPGKKTIPLEVEGADVMYVALSGKHSIISAAAIFNAAGINWTLSAFEAVNFGAFLGDPQRTRKIANRIISEATRLKVRKVAIVECGTAFRILKQQFGKLPFEVVTFVELIAEYHQQGKIKLNKVIDEKVTYHDPCQIARNAGVYDAPRYVLQQLTDNFVDMVPNREENWCCGGGGGLVAAGDFEFRMKSSKVKVEQMQKTGADIVATACENCHSQLHDLCGYYNTNQHVEFVSHLAARGLSK